MKGGAAKVEVATLAHSFTQMMLLGLFLKLKVSSEEDKTERCWVWCQAGFLLQQTCTASRQLRICAILFREHHAVSLLLS